MEAVACACPTCGAPYTSERPRVDLDRNIFICSNGAAKVSPYQAEMLAVLIEKHPEAASHEFIFSRVYGVHAGPDAAEAVLRSQVCNIRAKLRPLGWRVRANYARAYLLERIEE